MVSHVLAFRDGDSHVPPRGSGHTSPPLRPARFHTSVLGAASYSCEGWNLMDFFARDLLDFERLHIRGEVSGRQLLLHGVARAVFGLKSSNLCTQRGYSTLRTALIHPHSFFLSEGMRAGSAWEWEREKQKRPVQRDVSGEAVGGGGWERPEGSVT